MVVPLRLFRSFSSRVYNCFGGSGAFVLVFLWFRFGVSVVPAVPVASFRWFSSRCFGV